MGDLTDDRPKPLLEIGGRTLLEYKLDALPQEVDEVILVVSYLGSLIHDRFGGTYGGRRLLYVEQESATGGTADALWQASEILEGRFFVMNGDNLYAGDDMRACMPHEWAVVVRKSDSVKTGDVVADKHMRVTSMRENTDHKGGAGWANTGLYLLDMRIFEYPPVAKSPGSVELGLPQTMMQAAHKIDIRAVPASFWLEIKSPDDLAAAERALA